MEIDRSQDWKIRGVQLGYILGLSLIIAAIIYFFASNWPGFDKWVKIALSISLMVFFYIVSFLLANVAKRHLFLSQLFLFIACLSFGVSVALIGQIYNSHADSFMLFIIWSIPAILFSFFTKYQPFYVLSYGLLHVALWFYLYPSSGFPYVPVALFDWIYLAVALINGLLFFAIERDLLRSKPLKFLSFIMLHILMLSLTMKELFDPFNIFASLLYIVVLAFLYFYILKKSFHKGYLVIVGVASIAFVIIKFIEFIIFIGSESIFLFTMILPFIIVGLVIFGLRKLKLQQGEGNQSSFLKRIIVGITTAIASIIAASSLYGISFLFFDDIYFSFFIFLAAALIVLVKFKGNWDSIIRYTLLFTAYIIGTPAAINSDIWLSFLFICILIFAFWRFPSTFIRNITYFVIMIVLFGVFADLGKNPEFIAGLILSVNAVVYFGSRMIKNKPKLREILGNNSLFYGLLAFFALTFYFDEAPIFYYLTNGIYFVFTTVFVYLTLKRNNILHHRIFLAFWFAYIIYKYYDLIWGLLHKSVTFLITGLLIIAIARRFDTVVTIPRAAINSSRKIAVLIIIVLQLAILGVQVGKSESLLANGEMIKLELAPVDPRSLFQGDYLVLRYNISSLELGNGYWNERVMIGLDKGANGVYEYSGEYVVGKEIPEASRKKADVWITGKFKGYQNIEYGIENYFVQEGTGLDLEAKMNYAHVKVAKNGDALLVELTED